MTARTTLTAVTAAALLQGCTEVMGSLPDDTGSGASADGVLCHLSLSTFNDDESVNLESYADWLCDGEIRTLIANGVPDHEVGTFPNPSNPNTITEQVVEVDFPLYPELASDPAEERQVVAYALNGVKVEVGTGGSCDDAGDCSHIDPTRGWRMEASGEAGFDFGTDENNAHVQPFGAYHYHGIPELYLEQLGGGQAVTLVGWAVDGFPIYARWGHADADDAGSEVVPMAPSWVLTDDVPADRPSPDIYPLGAFTADWVYQEGAGDLDECNGRFGVTPEFPDGTYHYYLTDDFPFGQRCIKGTALVADEGPPAGGMPPR